MGCFVRLRLNRSPDRPDRFQSANRIHQVLVETSLESFQAESLRLRKVGGKCERAHVGQELAEALDPPFQLGGARRQDGRRIRRQGASRVAQDLFTIHVIRDPVRRDEEHGIRGAQPVLDDYLEHAVLVFCRESRQRVGRRWPDASPRQFFLSPDGQPVCELAAACHPVRLPPQLLRDGVGGQVVVGDERLDNERLVERGDGAGWRVGHQHEPLVVDGGERALHDRGDALASSRAPHLELLEAIEDFVVAIVGGRDPQRPVRQLCDRLRWHPPRTEMSEAGADAIDGKLAQGTVSARAGACLSVIELSWFARLTFHTRSPVASSGAARPQSRRPRHHPTRRHREPPRVGTR